MIGTRYEEYSGSPSELPFVLRIGLERTRDKRSAEMNWHEDPEIQLCTEGRGTVMINGERYFLQAGDFAAVNPNEIHYTGTEDRLVYTCLIVKADFCRQMGIDCNAMRFAPRFQNEPMLTLFRELETVYRDKDLPLRRPRLNDLVLQILILLAERHSVPRGRPAAQSRQYETVRQAVKYLREHYSRRLSLDETAAALCVDKYSLCRTFKSLTGQTVVEYLNRYRCRKASEYLEEGYNVSETAALCGFENLSFFAKTFKKYNGVLPSRWSRNED